jgi:hypothetical protein
MFLSVVNWDTVETAVVTVLATATATALWWKFWKILPARVGKLLTPNRRKWLNWIAFECIEIGCFAWTSYDLTSKAGLVRFVAWFNLLILALPRYLVCFIAVIQYPLYLIRDAAQPREEMTSDERLAENKGELNKTLAILCYVLASTSIAVWVFLYAALFHSRK